MSRTSTRKNPPMWAALLGAVAVAAVVGTVVLVTDGASERDLGASSAAGSPDAAIRPAAAANESPSLPRAAGWAGDVVLFGYDEPVDSTREGAVDAEGVWPVVSCAPHLGDGGRVEFVSGTEVGPDYARDLALGWYPNDTAAQVAWDGLWARVQECATSTGAAVQSETSTLGGVGVVAVVTEPSVDGLSEVRAYALIRVDSVLALVVDHGSFHDGSVFTPADALTTRESASWLLAELCRVDPTLC